MSKNNKMKVDSPEYNKKTKSKFIIIMIICFAVGGLGGFFGSIATNFFKGDLADIEKWFRENLPYFQTNVFPWILLSFAIICWIIGEVWLKKAKQQIATWDGEDDEHIGVADLYLSNVLTVSNVLMISIQFIFGIATYQLMPVIQTTKNIGMVLLNVVFYFVSLFITISLQSRAVKAIKEYAPEKKGSIYDSKFQKLWYQSCDEAERKLVGEASYRTVQTMNSVFSGFMTVTTIIAMFIPIGFLCTFFIGVLWLIMSCIYCSVCKELEHGKK